MRLEAQFQNGKRPPFLTFIFVPLLSNIFQLLYKSLYVSWGPIPDWKKTYFFLTSIFRRREKNRKWCVKGQINILMGEIKCHLMIQTSNIRFFFPFSVLTVGKIFGIQTHFQVLSLGYLSTKDTSSVQFSHKIEIGFVRIFSCLSFLCFQNSFDNPENVSIFRHFLEILLSFNNSDFFLIFSRLFLALLFFPFCFPPFSLSRVFRLCFLYATFHVKLTQPFHQNSSAQLNKARLHLRGQKVF